MPDGETPGPGGWNRIHVIVDDIEAQVDRLKNKGANFRNDIIEGLVDAARTAVADARAAGQTDHLQLIQNWGAPAGARTNHLCLDLYDLPQSPHRVAEELGGAARYVIREGECPWCRHVREEPRRPERLVWQDDDTVAFAPFASRSPFETWIAPTFHQGSFGELADDHLDDLAAILVRSLRAVRSACGDPDFNVVLYSAPSNEGNATRVFHWHLKLIPRIATQAGFEIGSAMSIRWCGIPCCAAGATLSVPMSKPR